MKLHYFARLRRTLYASITASLILLFVVACGGTTTTSTTTPVNTTPIKIGFSVSLAGDFSADGKALLMGYQLWQDAVNKRGGLLGRQVQLVYYNDSSDPQQVTTNYQKLIGSDHVNLLLGPFSTLLTVQAAPVAQRYGYTLIEGAGTGQKVFNSGFTTLFGASAPSQVYLGAFAQYILSLPPDQRPKTVAYATVDNPFAIPQVDYAKKVFADGGLQTVFDLPQPYPEEATDVSAIAKQIIHSGADVVVLGTVGVTDSVSFIKTFKQQHYNGIRGSTPIRTLNSSKTTLLSLVALTRTLTRVLFKGTPLHRCWSRPSTRFKVSIMSSSSRNCARIRSIACKVR